MRKQFTILLILIFVIGLISINFIKRVDAQTDSGLIAYWDFNQSFESMAGTIYDKVGNYNITNYGGTKISEGYDNSGIYFGCIGNAYQCNARTVNNLPEMSKFTILFRIKIDGNPTNTNDLRTIISSQGGSFSTHMSENRLGVCITGGGNCKNNIASLAIGEWYHFAFVLNNEILKIYKNGEFINSFWRGSQSIETQKWQIGNTPFTPGYTESGTEIILDEIKIYNIDLTNNQILEENNSNILSCTNDTWDCGNWAVCSSNGQQTKICTQTYNCPIVTTPSPATVQSCTPECLESSWSCSEWDTWGL